MYKLLRSLLFCLPAEASHNFALRAMKLGNKIGVSPLLAANTRGIAQPKNIMGIDFPHVLGLAAGLDKNADYVDALFAMGFAFVEVGTLTPRPQSGNPKPRMYRLTSERAIINRLGFNNKGIAYACERISELEKPGVVGINIGKNFDTAVSQANQDYIECLQCCYSLADYVSINISSPNTPGLRSLQFGDELNSLLDALKEEQAKLRKEYDRYTPIAVKLAPDLSPEEIESCCQSLISREMDAIIATNTTLDRSLVSSHIHAGQAGGLSGAPLSNLSCSVLKQIKAQVGEKMPIIGVGGIMSAQQAQQRLDAGADLLQIYTGFVYEGPVLIQQILSSLAHE